MALVFLVPTGRFMADRPLAIVRLILAVLLLPGESSGVWEVSVPAGQDPLCTFLRKTVCSFPSRWAGPTLFANRATFPSLPTTFEVEKGVI